MENVLLDSAGIAAKMESLADDLATALEQAGPPAELAIIGIKSRGDLLANRLIQLLSSRGLCDVEHGALDITFYRDDLHRQGGRKPLRITELPDSLDGKLIVLVDDVLQTGRSVRAALDALVDFGRPRAIRLAVLIDRGGREFPIQADYVGMKVDVPDDARVRLDLGEDVEAEQVVEWRDHA